MAYTLPNGFFIEVRISYVDKNGNPAVVDGAVTWDTSNTAVAIVEVDPSDSTKCNVAAVGTLGTAQISAEADADLGEGIRNIVTLFDVTVVAGEAVAGQIDVVGAPQPLP